MARYVSNALLKAGKKVVAIGKNYEAHAREMGALHAPKEPVIFIKPTSTYVGEGGSIQLPPGIGSVHHEVELGIVIGKTGSDIAETRWRDHVAGYVLTIDLTARDLQATAKKGGLPWTRAKCYDTFLPISDVIPASKVADPQDLNIWLSVDGVQRQRCNTRDMVHKIPFLISHISRIMTLEEGDVIITGTPEGVGPIEPGNIVTAGIDGLVEVKFPVESRLHSKF
ncbi:hypothetical protein H310_07315 [Aphanomyces invadans]|uniref:Fumarylacetoacetase-like C-terminal domain-containing protein n=1 Tax=Aphanomyces invadans TaxID=157072 RepID=A0A024U578_9STRA|nr:hypothetical protein H310_07315 [Aphanomyces invadans]ETW00778.1 hypothetical protein H310_07315 [Aphanomyces invadans]|eukprot:XP_008870913.1 hypothetical protein H310_07315 [Aphanomyces invadans]